VAPAVLVAVHSEPRCCRQTRAAERSEQLVQHKLAGAEESCHRGEGEPQPCGCGADEDGQCQNCQQDPGGGQLSAAGKVRPRRKGEDAGCQRGGTEDVEGSPRAMRWHG
jgi:hypothetical protein